MKTVFIDIDGTLFNSERTVSKKNIKVLSILKNKGINCYLISGRPRHKTMAIAKQANLGKYIISSTGADIYDYENNKVVYQSALDKTSVKEVYKLACENKVTIELVCGFIIYTNSDTSSTSFKKPIPTNDPTFFDTINVSQILIEGKNYNTILNLRDIVKNNFKKLNIANQTKSFYDKSFTHDEFDSAYFDINSPNINKGEGIKYLCEKIGIDLKDTICIGDSMNDLSMFQVVGKSVAMANSVKEVLAKADEITLSNDEDGVAEFLIKEFNLKV